MSESSYCVVFITTASEEEGRRIADRLLERKLCACVSLVPRVDSRFWWQGQLDSSSESMLIAKTKRSVLNELGRVVREAHSYQVPEIIALPIVWGSQSYLDWIEAEVQAKSPSEGAK